VSDTTLYAKWEVAKYTVSFEPNGGGSIASQTVNHNGKATTPAAITKTGYAFEGWYSDNAFGSAWNFSTGVVTGNVKLYAKWRPLRYILIFYAQGGTVSVADRFVTFDAVVGELPTPTRSGYTFGGWYTAENGGGTKYTEIAVYSRDANTTLYASWTVNSYTLTFDAQGGMVSPALLSVTFGSAVGTLPTPTRDGYTFGGWYTATNGGGTPYNSFTVYSTASNIPLYAKWTAKSYTIILDAQGGAASPARQSVTYGERVGTLPDPARAGCIFRGWYTVANGGGTRYYGSTVYSTASDIRLYALWSFDDYRLVFYAQGGTASYVGQFIHFGDVVGELPTATRAGYTFGGWYTAENGGGTKYTEKTVHRIDASIVLYASWTANGYTLSFDAQGGTVSPAIQSVTYEEKVGDLPTPTRGGYTFGGWYTSANGGGTRYSKDSNYSKAAN
jgi:uncharacterized repeat protein (TIGR02543 family)